MMKFNLKHIISCFLMIFSVLLVGVSGVCGSDVNETADMNTEINNINVTSLDYVLSVSKCNFRFF